MHTYKQSFSDLHIDYPLESVAPPEKILFFDIETTGFSPKTNSIYLIGCGYFSEGLFHIVQFFADKTDEEAEILRSFADFLKNYSCLVQFNGNNFDIPFVQQKCTHYEIGEIFSDCSFIDLYRCIFPYRTLLGLENCKQKTVERFLGIDREDTFSGGELINFYMSYQRDPEEDLLHLLLLHNSDDVKGLPALLPVLSYHDLFHKVPVVKKVQANTYTDYAGMPKAELILTAELPSLLPVSFRMRTDAVSFKGEGTTGVFRVPLLKEEMKYFYSGYKDYYYLPEEDIAVHKSMAEFIDKEKKTRCVPANCYTRKIALFIPQFGAFKEPFFKRSHKDSETFLELTDSLKTSRPFFGEYAAHLLDYLIKSY